jgi:hypothetical protein
MRYASRRLVALAAAMAAFFLLAPLARAQSTMNATWSVTIVLPSPLIAGQPSTLAVFGADKRLASGVSVEIGKDTRVVTDETGRATFTAPREGGYLLAKSSAHSAAALMDSDAPAAAGQTIRVEPVVSLKDWFTIRGAGFRGEADANRVKINGERALVLAASPECLIVMPGPKAVTDPAKVEVQTGESRWSADTTLVSLEFAPPQPPLTPEKKSRLPVRVQGTAQTLRIVVENETPGVLQFARGDSQELRTSGGADNFTEVEVQAVRSGDFSFHARLVPPVDLDAAQRYLQAAAPLAPKDLHRRLKKLSDRLAHHPRDVEKIGRELDQIVSATFASDLRTILESAAASI